MSAEAVISGILAIITGGIGVWLQLREAKEKLEDAVKAEMRRLREEVYSLETALTEVRRYAYTLRTQLTDTGAEVPPMPPPVGMFAEPLRPPQ